MVMPIEIKELTVKFHVEENNKQGNNQQTDKISPLAYKKLLRDCTREVIRNFERKKER